MNERMVAAQQISELVLQLARTLQDNFSRHAAAFDLTPAQAKILISLQEDQAEAVPMRMLAERLGIDASNFTAPVDQLESAGHLRRLPDPTDRRAKILVATPQGTRLRKAFWEAMSQDVGFLEHLKVTELRDLRRLLTAAAAPLDEPETPSARPRRRGRAEGRTAGA